MTEKNIVPCRSLMKYCWKWLPYNTFQVETLWIYDKIEGNISDFNMAKCYKIKKKKKNSKKP